MIHNFPSNSAYHSSHTVVLHRRSDYHSFGLYVAEDVPSGVYVVTVAPNSPAANSNIQPGDRVLAINEQLVSSMHNNPIEMIRQLSITSQSLTLTIQPSNILQTLNVPLSNNLNNDNYNYSVPSKPNISINNDLER
jgi:S1-C subfamily serine protease